MRGDDGAVDQGVFEVRLIRHPLEQALEDPGPHPAAEPLEHAVPVAEPARQVARAATGALVPEFCADEPDRHDAEPLGRTEQPETGSFPRLVVLELDLPEASQGVADVARIDDREAPATLRVDVRERAVGQPSGRRSLVYGAATRGARR